MDKAGIIAQIIKAEGLKGPDAEARKRSLDNKDLNELEQMLNSALSNSKTYKADGTESNFSFLGDNNWADMTGVGFDGNVWGNNIVNSENEQLLPDIPEERQKKYSLVQQKKLDEFLAQFLYDSATEGLNEITSYNRGIGWVNFTDRAINGFKVLTGQEDRFGLQDRMKKEQQAANELRHTASAQPGAFEAKIERKYGIPFSHENVENLKKASEEFTRVSAYHDKFEKLKKGFKEVKNILRQEQEYEHAKKYVRGAAAAALTPPKQSSHEKFGKVLLEFCDGDKELLTQYMDSLSKKYTSSSEIDKNLPKIMDELQKNMDAEYKKELNGKSFEKYEAEFNKACEKVLGEKDAKTIAKNFVANAKTQAAFTEIGIVIATSVLLPGSSLVKGAVQRTAVKYGQKAALQGFKAGMTAGAASTPAILSGLNAATSKDGFTPEKIEEIKQKFKNGLIYGGFGAYVSGPLGLAVEKVLSKNPSLLTNLVTKAIKPTGITGAQLSGGAVETSADVLFDLLTSDMSLKESFEMNGLMNLGMMVAGGQIARGLENDLKMVRLKYTPDGTYQLKDHLGNKILETKDPNTVAGYVLGKGVDAANKAKQKAQQGVKVSDYRAEKADEAALKEIHKIDMEAFAETDPVPEKFEDYKAYLEEQNIDSYVIKNKDGKVTGYFQLEPMHGDQLYIYSIGVPKELRNTKSSFATLKQIQENIKNIALEKGAKTVALHVDASNKPLVKLYEKFGFKTVDTEQNYFANGDDALYMELNVSEHINIKDGMESNAAVELFKKYGFKAEDLGENVQYLNSIVHDLGEDFVKIVEKNKDKYREPYFTQAIIDFANIANPKTARYIHELTQNNPNIETASLNAFFQKPAVIKNAAELYTAVKETGMDDIIDLNDVNRSINATLSYFDLGTPEVLRRNLSALKQSGISLDASDGVNLILDKMTEFPSETTTDEIVAVLKDINRVAKGKTFDDSSLSTIIDVAAQSPRYLNSVLKYAELFGGEPKDIETFALLNNGLFYIENFAHSDIITRMQKSGYSIEQTADVLQRFCKHYPENGSFRLLSPEYLDGLFTLVDKTINIKQQTLIGEQMEMYHKLLNIDNAENFRDIVNTLFTEIPDLKIDENTIFNVAEVINNFSHFRTPEEIKSVINELKSRKMPVSLVNIQNFINLKKLKPEIQATISGLHKNQQKLMKYMLEPKNILKHSESMLDKNALSDLARLSTANPQILKEIFVLDDATAKARGGQFSFSQINDLIDMKPKQYEVFKGLMFLDEKYLPQKSSETGKEQFSFVDLMTLSREALVKDSPESSVIIDRVKELLLLHKTPGVKTTGLSANDIANFLALDEKGYQRVKELYSLTNQPANIIAKAATLPDKQYNKLITEYFDGTPRENFSFYDAITSLTKSKDSEMFDGVMQLLSKNKDYPMPGLAIRGVSDTGFTPQAFAEKLSSLNRNINPAALGSPFMLDKLDPARLNDFYDTLMKSKKQLQHNDRPMLQDHDISNLLNGAVGYKHERDLTNLFFVLDDEAIKHSISGKYDGVQHFLSLSGQLYHYNSKELQQLKEGLSNLPTAQQRFDKFSAIMEVTATENRPVMELIDILKSPKITDEQIQTMKNIFASDKPYEQQIEDFIREMNVPKVTEQKVRNLLSNTNYKNRVSRKTVNKKAELAKIERNIAATIANNDMSQAKKDARLSQLNAQKEALKYKQDGTTITMSSGALSDLTRIVEQHINIVNNDIEFNRALTDKIYTKHGIHPSLELQDKLKYDSKYTTKLLSGDSKFSPEYGKLIELLDTDPSKPLSELRESIPENQATRKLFEENGLDYEKWIKFDETFEKPFTLEVDARSALDAVQRNAAAEFSSDLVRNLPKKDRDFIESVIADVYKNKFKTDKPLGYISNNGFVKQDGTALNRQQHITLIQDVIDKIKENKEFGIEKQADGTTKLNENVNEFLNHLESRIKDLNDAAQLKDMSEELYVRLSDDDDIGRNIFFGNHVSCCTSVQNFNGFAQPQHLMNTYVRGIEIVDKNGTSYGNSMCYFAKVDGKLTFIVDSFEANGKLGASKDVTNAVIDAGKLICAEMGRPDIPVMFGPNYNKIDKSRFVQTEGHTIEVVGRAPERTYIDCIGGRGNINEPASQRSMNEINNLAPISDVRPPLKKVETLSQREVRNINQNAQNIAQNIHANAKESLQSIENIFGLKKGANSDGSVLMYREKGEPGLIKKYYRKVLKYDEMIENAKRNELTPEQIALGQKPLTPEEQQIEINKLLSQKRNLIYNMQSAQARLGDSQGARIVMDNPTPEKIEEFTQKIISGIEKGEIEVLDFENYGKNAESTYFTKEQIERIKEATGGKNENINPLPKVKKSNYTTSQMTLRLKNGTYIELQIRGKEINELAEAEHILYKIREGEGGPATVEKAYNKICSDNELNAKYEKYISEWYDHSRKAEMGLETKRPELPDGDDKVLDMNYLMNLVRKGLAH